MIKCKIQGAKNKGRKPQGGSKVFNPNNNDNIIILNHYFIFKLEVSSIYQNYLCNYLSNKIFNHYNLY
jgi:hypothetical protein